MQPRHPDDTPAPIWRQRPKPIGVENVYRLDGGTLELDNGRSSERVPLDTVERVRFFYAPSNVTSHGYRTQIRLAGGRTLTFGNLSWRSLTDIDRDDASYHAFVAALSAAITRANPKARFVAGKPYVAWAALAVVGAIAIVLLAAFALRAFQRGETTAGYLGIALAAASVWQVWPMVKLNRPRELGPGEVPDTLVPGRIGAPAT